jgi:CubicO group peptidase (beta-lactamase class C family)
MQPIHLAEKETQIMKTKHHLIVLILATGLLLSSVMPVLAEKSQAAAGKNEAVISSQPQGPTDAAEMEKFMDTLFARQMDEYHIAGAAVAVVKDGQLFFTKGYGYADLENKIPVDPATTIFRTGSVGKVFTWTAVMQLVEQGKLDLDTDVNTYLDFRIPDTYPQPITLKHLMTHTSGIEDRWLESLTADSSELVPARDWLIANFPGRVRAPGEAAGYSNYNAMLAGYIVSRVSGEPYDDYIQKHIFDPLGMTHSTVHPQMPENLLPFVSKSYSYVDGAFQPFPIYFTQEAVLPSGFHQTSVTDMARFMIARLEGGSFGGDASTEMRILKEDTARQMLTTLYTPDPRLKGTAYGLFDFSDNGQWVLGHTGYAPVMFSELLFLPDQHLGVYVVYNSFGARAGGLADQHTGFQRAFFDHYYPAAAATPFQSKAEFAPQAGRFTGFYRAANSHSTTPEKVQYLFESLEIRDGGNGTLVVPLGEGLELRFVEVEPLYLRQVDGPYSMFFREDDQGNIVYMFTDIIPEWGFRKLDWYETPGFNMVLAQVCVLLLLSMLPVGLIRFIRNRRSSHDQNPALPSTRVADSILFGISLLNMLFLIGIVLWFRPMHPSELHSIPSIIEIVMGLAVLAAVLTAGALVYTVLAWKNGYWGIAYRVYYTLVTVAAVAFVWFLNYWNWLGWRY